jgi:flagellar basal-body rod protein FlgG
MAVAALHSASTGLSALSTELDVLANNLANVNNVGFKRSRVNFEDLLYLQKAQPGVLNANGDQRPTGTSVGLGTRVSGTQVEFTQGSLVPTGNDLDLAIDGSGFFQVDVGELGEGVAYTRAGNFMINAEGEIVLGNSDGRRLVPPIQVPDNYVSIEVAADGTVFAKTSEDAEPEELDRLQLAAFVNPAGLEQIGGDLFVQTAASGAPIVGDPGDGQFGRIVSKFLEGSNVDPVKELVALIKTQRSFEMNSQSIQAADEALQVVSNLRRF